MAQRLHRNRGRLVYDDWHLGAVETAGGVPTAQPHTLLTWQLSAISTCCSVSDWLLSGSLVSTTCLRYVAVTGPRPPGRLMDTDGGWGLHLSVVFTGQAMSNLPLKPLALTVHILTQLTC